ncbi:MAG: disulfide reductase [Deltaproteobacteria bacterium]|nr:disulfide reductase [Deltaproteobacteria bacterium]
MTRYAFFLGCHIPARVEQYEISARAVLNGFGVELVDIPEFKCCGYPLRNIDREAFVFSSAYNLAVAESAGLDILALCKCGFGTLKEAAHLLGENADLRERTNTRLSDMGLEYRQKSQVKHFLSVLHHDVGLKNVKEKISKKYEGLNIATHYGCHALRPSDITQFDDPVAPTIFDSLVASTGAKSVDWAHKLDCCGAPLLGINDDMSHRLTGKKLESAKKAHAHFICTACPYCQIQFDTIQSNIPADGENGEPLAPVLYPQLLGLAMGIPGEDLGIGMNRLDITGLKNFLTEE